MIYQTNKSGNIVIGFSSPSVYKSHILNRMINKLYVFPLSSDLSLLLFNPILPIYVVLKCPLPIISAAYFIMGADTMSPDQTATRV